MLMIRLTAIIRGGKKSLKNICRDQINETKLKKIFENLEEFKFSITSLKSQEDTLEEIFKTLLKFQKKIKYIFLEMEEVSIASHFSMDLTNNSQYKVL